MRFLLLEKLNKNNQYKKSQVQKRSEFVKLNFFRDEVDEEENLD